MAEPAQAPDEDTIDRLLRAVRGRQRRVLQAEGASWGLASGAVLWLAGALTGNALPALAVGLLWAAPAAGALVGMEWGRTDAAPPVGGLAFRF